MKTIALILALIATSIWMNPVLAGPNCEKKPDHPQCDDGGGSDPGGGDACLDSTTIPSFVFRRDPGSVNVTEFFLSDAEGACTQLLTTYDAPDFSIQGEMKMHYKPPTSVGGTGSGRVIWEDDASGDLLFLLEFEVAPDKSVSSTDAVPILSTLEIGGIGDFDIGSDHDSLAFSYHWPDTQGNGYPDGESLYVVSINDCLSSTWIPSDPTTCNKNGSRQEVLSIPNTNINDSGTRWTGLTWNRDGTRIYLHQSKHTEVSGIHVAELVDPGPPSIWEYSLVASGITLGGGTLFPTATSANWDGRGDREIVAYRFDDGNTVCDEIHVIDVEDCRGPSEQCGNIGPDIFGRTPSFTNHGQLVFNELRPKGKNRCANPGKISIVDPFTSGAVPKSIVDGQDPDG